MSSRTRIWSRLSSALVGLLVFVVLAQAFVDGGQVVSFDDNVSRWVADNVPGGVEWVARALHLARRRRRHGRRRRHRGRRPAGGRRGGSTRGSWRSSVVGITVLVAGAEERSTSGRGPISAARSRCRTRTRSRAGTRRPRSSSTARSGCCSPSGRDRRSAQSPGSSRPRSSHSRSGRAASSSTSTS